MNNLFNKKPIDGYRKKYIKPEFKLYTVFTENSLATGSIHTNSVYIENQIINSTWGEDEVITGNVQW